MSHNVNAPAHLPTTIRLTSTIIHIKGHEQSVSRYPPTDLSLKPNFVLSIQKPHEDIFKDWSALTALYIRSIVYLIVGQ